MSEWSHASRRCSKKHPSRREPPERRCHRRHRRWFRPDLLGNPAPPSRCDLRRMRLGRCSGARPDMGEIAPIGGASHQERLLRPQTAPPARASGVPACALEKVCEFGADRHRERGRDPGSPGVALRVAAAPAAGCGDDHPQQLAFDPMWSRSSHPARSISRWHSDVGEGGGSGETWASSRFDHRVAGVAVPSGLICGDQSSGEGLACGGG